MSDFNLFPQTVTGSLPQQRARADDRGVHVASRLLAGRLRPHLTAFHRFVRAGQTIADDPDLEPEVRLAYLDALERALTGEPESGGHARIATELRISLASTGVSDAYARHFLRALRRDAVGGRCQSWSDLLLHCRFAANPIGRFLLDLHGEDAGRAGPASDALFTAMRVLGLMQAARADWVTLGRCYVPLSWFTEAGVSVERLVETECDPELRGIFDRLLDHADRLLLRAEELPRMIRHRSLRMEIAALLCRSEALSRRLRICDPLRRRVALRPHERAMATLRGMIQGFAPPSDTDLATGQPVG